MASNRLERRENVSQMQPRSRIQKEKRSLEKEHCQWLLQHNLRELSPMKKAQGLPLNVIIIAIIVLIVLVVLVAISTGKISFGKEEFDPEKHECLERDTINYDYKCVEWQPKNPDDIRFDPNKDTCIQYETTSCLKNITAEVLAYNGTTFNLTVKAVEPDTCINEPAQLDACGEGIINRIYYGREEQNTTECMDWRPKNECEKGNPAYMVSLEINPKLQVTQKIYAELPNEISAENTANLPEKVRVRWDLCRPKTTCEIDPEAEGCICDEWRIVSVDVWIPISQKDFIDVVNTIETCKTNQSLLGSPCRIYNEKTEQYSRGVSRGTMDLLTNDTGGITFDYEIRKTCTKAHEAKICPEGTKQKEITCDCAKNTTTPCALYCFECVK